MSTNAAIERTGGTAAYYRQCCLPLQGDATLAGLPSRCRRFEFLPLVRDSCLTADARLARARDQFVRAPFSRGDRLGRFPTLSTATASRDLASDVATGQLVRTGDKALARYRFAGVRRGRR